MKKITLLSVCLILLVHFINAQDSLRATFYKQRGSTNNNADYYLSKSKTLIPTGAVLMAVGAGAIIGGAVGTYQSYDLFTGEGTGYVILWVVGVASFATGIPLLVKGLVFHHKAKMILRAENLNHSFHVPGNANMITSGIAISF